MPWTRPADVPVGKVWARFKGRERNGAPALMYQIRDVEKSYSKQCLDMMEITFIRDEPICHALGISLDSESKQTIRNNWEEMLAQQICIACFTEENGEPKELVGFNIMYVRSKDDEDDDVSQVKGPWRQCLKTLTEADKLVNIFEYYNIDQYLTSSGLTVVPEHRGQNLGARMIEVRKEICKAFGIKAVSTIFTAKTSQVLAAKCNYETIAVFPYTEMLKHGVDLSNCSTTEAKVMGIKYDF